MEEKALAEPIQLWTPLAVPPAHPAAHGPISWRVEHGGGVITAIEPRIDLAHRGVEKLFESRDYRQCLVLADRHDWHSALNSELGLAQLIESALGITVPERAGWARTLLAELSRSIHAFSWLAETVAWLEGVGTGSDVASAAGVPASDPGPEPAGGVPDSDPGLASAGISDLVGSARQARHQLIDEVESISGSRLHPMLVQPGGLRTETPPGWALQVRAAVSHSRPIAKALRDWLDASGLAGSLSGIARVDLEAATTFGASGTFARAAGLGIDLRFEAPDAKYSQLRDAGVLRRVQAPGAMPAVAVAVAAGDALSRLRQLAAELLVSLDCVRFCADQLIGPYSGGPMSVRLPRNLRVPEGAYYAATESPTGISGWFLVSRADTRPYRLKIQAASFNNARALCAGLIGRPLSELTPATLTSLLVVGDLGR